MVALSRRLLHGGPEAGGAMTSGGTESILMAVKTARERARAERGVTRPELVAPFSAHPAFAKAAHYLGLELKQIPLEPDFRADVAAAEKLIGDNTALVVGSAPNYPFGVIDPIPELAGLAAARGAAFHTDACLGGFLLPFLEAIGEKIPPFDFRVPGVSRSPPTSQVRLCIKGASGILHGDKTHVNRHQLFLWERWPGGTYGSFAMAGARPSAPIAAAWAVLHHLGREGYQKLAREVRDTTRKLRAGIDAIPGLRVIGEPAMSVLAFGSAHRVFAVGDRMDQKGWHLDRQKGPDALHLMVSPMHARIADAFLADLREAAVAPGKSKGKDARYS